MGIHSHAGSLSSKAPRAVSKTGQTNIKTPPKTANASVVNRMMARVLPSGGRGRAAVFSDGFICRTTLPRETGRTNGKGESDLLEAGGLNSIATKD